MKVSDNGVNLIKSFEGLRLKAYKDSAGVWTIGYGSTRYSNGQPVRKGDVLEHEIDATKLFKDTLVLYEKAVNVMVTVPIEQHQFDALVSLCYNIGTVGLAKSSLIKLLNSGNLQAAANQFLVWNKITEPVKNIKIISATLQDRREKERQLFLS